MNFRKVELLGTTACHLCELAVDVVEQFNETMKAHNFQLNVKNLDIASSAALVEVYGNRIPVIIDWDTKKELDWPFDPEGLYNFLRECST
jgi:hypothetical protein